MKDTIYTLPRIDFVGGQNETLNFRLYDFESKEPYDASGCQGEFAIVYYSSPFDEPVITKSASFIGGVEGITNVASVHLDTSDTLDLHGKFIYQITIKDQRGHVEIPYQGIFIVYNNIDQDYIR